MTRLDKGGEESATTIQSSMVVLCCFTDFVECDHADYSWLVTNGGQWLVVWWLNGYREGASVGVTNLVGVSTCWHDTDWYTATTLATTAPMDVLVESGRVDWAAKHGSVLADAAVYAGCTGTRASVKCDVGCGCFWRMVFPGMANQSAAGNGALLAGQLSASCSLSSHSLSVISSSWLQPVSLVR